MERALNRGQLWYVEHKEALPYLLMMDDGVRWLWMYGDVLRGEEGW